LYPHNFNTEENLDYTGPIPDVSYYGVNEMGEGERNEFLAWYESQKESIYDNRQALESYCQDDVIVLRQACRVFRNERTMSCLEQITREGYQVKMEWECEFDESGIVRQKLCSTIP